jgi:hypothetical protein
VGKHDDEGVREEVGGPGRQARVPWRPFGQPELAPPIGNVS